MSAIGGDLRQLIESDQKAARPLLHDLVERLPKSAEARALLANSYLRSLEAAPALDHYRLAHALEPANLGVRHQMGLCAVALGDYEDALAIYREAMEIAPREHSAAMAALMLHRLGKFADAANAYSKLLATLKRDHPEAPHALRGPLRCFETAACPCPQSASRMNSSPCTASIPRALPPRWSSVTIRSIFMSGQPIASFGGDAKPEQRTMYNTIVADQSAVHDIGAWP